MLTTSGMADDDEDSVWFAREHPELAAHAILTCRKIVAYAMFDLAVPWAKLRRAMGKGAGASEMDKGGVDAICRAYGAASSSRRA